MSTNDRPLIPASQWFDRLGVFASTVCALHCLCLPWLLLAMPFLAGTVLASRGHERVFVLASIVLAGGCALAGCRRHRQWWLLGPAALGALTLTVVHATAPSLCCPRELSWPHALGAALGGSLLAGAHFLNLRLVTARTSAPASLCGDHLACPTHRDPP